MVRARAEARPPRRGPAPTKGREGERLEAARDEAAEARLGRGAQKTKGDEPRVFERGARREPWGDAPGGWSGPGADVRPLTPRSEVAATAEPVTASEAVARIEEIAKRLVEAIEMHVGPRGAAEVRLELNLGRLGSLHVELARGEDGHLRASFEATSEPAAELVRTRVEELRGALDVRGISLNEVTVRGPEGAAEPVPVRAAASGEEAAARHHGGDEGERRQSRREPDRGDEEQG